MLYLVAATAVRKYCAKASVDAVGQPTKA